VSFIHDDPDFPQLLAIVARETGIAAALVEKDYWVTHCLWALHETGGSSCRVGSCRPTGAHLVA
jgi:hypothetical protein